MPRLFAFAVFVTALSISPLTAQIRGSGTAGFGISAGSPGIASAGRGSAGFGHGVAAPFRSGHSSGRSTVFLPYPYFYSDSDYVSGEEAQPQVVVVQAAAPAPPPAPPAPRESLLIEWQGDHFVRSTASGGAQLAADYSEKSASPSSVVERSAAERPGPGTKNAVQPARELPPAVLVFRDGRREELSEYTIMSGTIYSKADYWTTGSWTRKIQIADLDVPATLKLNQERGLKFVLPASSNEVIIRP